MSPFAASAKVPSLITGFLLVFLSEPISFLFEYGCRHCSELLSIYNLQPLGLTSSDIHVLLPREVTVYWSSSKPHIVPQNTSLNPATQISGISLVMGSEIRYLIVSFLFFISLDIYVFQDQNCWRTGCGSTKEDGNGNVGGGNNSNCTNCKNCRNCSNCDGTYDPLSF